MAESFQFDLVSPERSLLSGPVEMVTVPGMEGDFGVLKGHAPFMSTLRPGFVEIARGGGDALKVFVTGGFADVTPAGLTLLADEAHEAGDVTGALFDRLVESARKESDRTADAHAKARSEQRLRDLELLRAQLRM
jgi:F-type H+-transporting ATPase subunit epsilon